MCGNRFDDRANSCRTTKYAVAAVTCQFVYRVVLLVAVAAVTCQFVYRVVLLVAVAAVTCQFVYRVVLLVYC